MDVRVAGHQVDTGESLREHAQQRIAEITEKYFSRAVGAERDLRPRAEQRFYLRHRRPGTCRAWC